MRLTEYLKKTLRVEENTVAHAYQDHLGFWTIGVGHLVDKRKGAGLSPQVIELQLDIDVQEKIDEVERALPWSKELDQVRFAALVLMAFQLGTSGLLGFKNMLLSLRYMRWKEAHDHALDSKWARQDTPARAKRVATMLLVGTIYNNE